jgi:hypothetical protein
MKQLLSFFEETGEIQIDAAVREAARWPASMVAVDGGWEGWGVSMDSAFAATSSV